MNTIALKIKKYDSLAIVAKIIRSYKNKSINEIKKEIDNNQYVLEYDFLELDGVLEIRKCFNELSSENVLCEVYDDDDELMSITELDNLIESYKQTEKELYDSLDY